MNFIVEFRDVIFDFWSHLFYTLSLFQDIDECTTKKACSANARCTSVSNNEENVFESERKGDSPPAEGPQDVSSRRKIDIEVENVTSRQ